MQGLRPGYASGFCGWFGALETGDPASRILANMAGMAAAEPAGGPAGHGASRPEIVHRDAAVRLDSIARAAGLVDDDGTIAVIDGFPSWSDDALAGLASKHGNAAALAEAWRRHGPDLLRHVHGPFSLAVFHPASRSGVLAIDRMGIANLCYAHDAGGALVFGTTAGAVAANALVGKRISLQALYDYLMIYRVPAPLTIYQGVEKLLPGQFAAIEAGTVRTGFYWRMPYAAEGRRDEDALKKDLLDRLRGGVRDAIDGEEPERVGAFLSGGLDSSTIAGLMRETGGPATKAFTIGFEDDAYDETEYAMAAAEHFGIEHIVYRVTPDDVCDLIPRMNEALDEPNGNSSCVPTYYCAHVAREHGISLMLGGDGGDELFAGNTWYAQMKVFEVYHAIPGFLRRNLIEPVVFGMPGGERFFLTRKGRAYIGRANTPMPDRMFSPEAGLITDIDNVLEPETFASIDRDHPIQAMRDAFGRTDSPHLMHRMMHQDLTVILADNDLKKVGRMCALAGVQVRFPMLDERVVELAATLPPELLVRGRKHRYFYRNAVRDYLPEKIIRKTKHGFGLPFGNWLTSSRRVQDIAYDALEKVKRRGFVREDYVAALIERQKRERYAGYAGPIWDLMLLEYWFQRHVDDQEHVMAELSA